MTSGTRRLRSTADAPATPDAQAVFCIDVRSEPLRRALEATGPYATLGFAGFFGLAVNYAALGSDTTTEQFPVLVSPSATIHERARPGHETEADAAIDRANRRTVEHVLELSADRARREWGLRMVVVARTIERIGDRAVDIGRIGGVAQHEPDAGRRLAEVGGMARRAGRSRATRRNAKMEHRRRRLAGRFATRHFTAIGLQGDRSASGRA